MAQAYSSEEVIQLIINTHIQGEILAFLSINTENNINLLTGLV